MSRMYWFRFYDEVLDDPKVQTLSPAMFKIWVNTLCLASRHNGKLPPIQQCSFALRETVETVSSAFHTFQQLRFIETDGETFHFISWRKRQYKSDISTDRVKKFRDKVKRFKAVSETAPDTETEADIKKINKKSYPQTHVLDGLSSLEAFEIFRASYPALKRGGKPESGRRAWDDALASGAIADDIIAGLEALKKSPDAKFLPGWVKFLENRVWEGGLTAPETPARATRKCEFCKNEISWSDSVIANMHSRCYDESVRGLRVVEGAGIVPGTAKNKILPGASERLSPQSTNAAPKQNMA